MIVEGYKYNKFAGCLRFLPFVHLPRTGVTLTLEQKMQEIKKAEDKITTELKNNQLNVLGYEKETKWEELKGTKTFGM